LSIDLNKIFGRAMKTWRTGRELSQSQAAELFKMSQAGYSKMEAGGVDTGLDMVAKALDVTGLSLSVLLSPQGSPERSGGEQTTDSAVRFLTESGYSVTLKKDT
jgi:transcriptional regulator with XRE-family HTH domain